MPFYFAPILLSVFLALLHRWRLVRADQTLIGVLALIAALISGLRFEIGQDWPAYAQFFDDVDVGVGPIDSFTGHSGYPAFEFGYHELNYLIKILGGNYHLVLLVASLFISFSIYKLIMRIRANGFYVLAMYFSYGYLVLQFAQVRQSLAIGFILLACAHYATSRNRLQTLFIAMLGVLFQFSALMYVGTLALALYWRENWSVKMGFGFLVLFCAPLLFFREQINFYTVLAEIAFSESAQGKIAIYEQMQEPQGSGVVFVAMYLLAMTLYLVKYAEVVDPSLRYLVRFAIAATLLTVLFVAIFPDSYVMFSRAYVVASILQGAAVAMVVENRRGAPHLLMLLGSLAFAIVYCLRLLILMSHEYFPYRTFLFG
jgi:hypothetical protein